MTRSGNPQSNPTQPIIAAPPRPARCAGLLLLGALVASTGMEAAAQDATGKEWRQLSETTGLSWEDVAQVCPTDGATPCSGSIGDTDLTHWVWASADQVVDFMASHEPALVDAEPPFVSGSAHFFTVPAFFSVMRSTGFASGYGFYSEWTRGLTSSLDPEGMPLQGQAGYGWWPPTGSIGVSSVDEVASRSSDRGVWLWRPTGMDASPPLVISSIVGTAGNSGWFVSDVTVAWDVDDPDSTADIGFGCEQETVTTDGSFEFSCEATSEGGTTAKSVIVARDTTAPTLSCAPTSQFELGEAGATVTASVSDAVSGPAAATVSTAASTAAGGSFTASVTGSDNAGNSATIACSYEVIGDEVVVAEVAAVEVVVEDVAVDEVVAEEVVVEEVVVNEVVAADEEVVSLCAGQTPTIVGTSGDDVINGTNGKDVILALGGNDTINARGGDDIVCAGDGDDEVNGGDGADRIYGEAGDDELEGGRGADDLDGGAGDEDSIRGGDGRDRCTSGEDRMSSCREY